MTRTRRLALRIGTLAASTALLTGIGLQAANAWTLQSTSGTTGRVSWGTIYVGARNLDSYGVSTAAYFGGSSRTVSRNSASTTTAQTVRVTDYFWRFDWWTALNNANYGTTTSPWTLRTSTTSAGTIGVGQSAVSVPFRGAEVRINTTDYVTVQTKVEWLSSTGSVTGSILLSFGSASDYTCRNGVYGGTNWDISCRSVDNFTRSVTGGVAFKY